ncbi:MAG: FG-GAP-like repeat-containing protein, partial [Candidatus Paceibacterota bacterium]
MLKINRTRRRRRRKRLRIFEVLEDRRLLVSDLQNPDNALDVNADQHVSPLDALLIINRLAPDGSGEMAGKPEAGRNRTYPDTNGDTYVSPIDALLVINDINAEAEDGSPQVNTTGFISIAVARLPGDETQMVSVDITESLTSNQLREAGIFVMGSEAGDVAGLPPSHADYARTVLVSENRQSLFPRMDSVEETESTTMAFQGGSYLGLYVLQPDAPQQGSSDYLRATPRSANEVQVGWEEHQSVWVGLPVVGDRGYDDATFDIRIGDPGAGDSVPVLDDIADRSIDELTSLAFTVAASDIDLPNDTLSFTLTSAPPGAVIDEDTGRFSWTPTEAQGPGQFDLTVQVTDNQGSEDSKDFRVTVNEVNQPPSLNQIGDKFARGGALLSFTATASDPDLPANALTFSLEADAPAGATIDATTGRFSWTPPVAAGESDVAITIRVTDNGTPALSDTETFHVTVGNCPFNDHLTGWTTSESGGTATGHGTVTAQDCVVTLAEGDSFLTTLATTFIVPDGATELSFTYSNLNFDTTGPDFINDAFEVALLDRVGNPLVSPYVSNRDAFFNVTEEFDVTVGTGVAVAGTNVVVDLSGILAGEAATLVFRLANNDEDARTSVAIDNIRLPSANIAPSDAEGSGGASGAAFFGSEPSIVASNANLFSAHPTVQPVSFGPFASSNVNAEGETDATVVEFIRDQYSILPESINVLSTPSVMDLNGDGIPEIVYTTYGGQNRDNALRAVSGNGEELWSVTQADGFRANWAGQTAIGDIDGDGRPDIIAIETTGGFGHNNDAPRLVAFESDGSFKWRSADIWGGAGSGAPAIADLDSDGTVEIIIGGTVLNGRDGTIRWEGRDAGGTGRGSAGFGGLSITADIDLDGQQEVLAGKTAYDTDGTVLWELDADDGFNAVGNFDDDLYPEIVFVSNGTVRLLHHDGTELLAPVPIPGGGRGGAPTVADFDNDGEPEFAVAGASRFVVFERDGSILWEAVTQDISSNFTGSSVFDFDGDGAAEVVYGDEQFLRIYNGVDGEVLYAFERSSSTGHELPVVADVDGDGATELVFGAGFDRRFPTQGRSNGLIVLGNPNWVATRPIWNQHSYHITNINDDGSIPRQEANSWEVYNNYRRNRQPTGTQFGPPSISVSAPNTLFPAGSQVILTGIASADGTRADGSANAIDLVDVNGAPVHVLDPAGQFFTQVEILPGDNAFTFTATDSGGQTVSTSLTLRGVEDEPDIDVARFADVTASFAGVYGRTSFNEEPNILYVDLATRNDGAFETETPLLVGVKNISKPSVSVVGADGLTPDGIPF